MMVTLSRRPASAKAATVSCIAGKAVVSRHERPMTLASLSRAASTNCCAGTSTPRSTTLNPFAESTLATMFLPMSWMSVCTVPSTTVPRVPVSAADWSRPSSARAFLKISADMMSSERKYSPASYLSPIVFMPACRAAMMSAGVVPVFLAALTAARTSSSRISTSALVRVSVN